MATDRTASPTGPGSARFEDAGEPSRAEIQQRVSALYDRAESDSGTFNATRAMKRGNRRVVTSVANSGRRAADPSLEAVARQWFDMARSRIGPTTSATLPADRMPERPAGPPRPQRPAGSDAVRELEAGGGSRLELEAGERRGPELTSRAVAALPAAPAPRHDEPRALPAAPAALPPAASTPAAAPAAPQSKLRNNKEQIRRKLASAREVLARGVAQPVPALPAIAARPAEQTWDTGQMPAYRPTADAWSGQQSNGVGIDTSGVTGGNSLATGTWPVQQSNGLGIDTSGHTGGNSLATGTWPVQQSNGLGIDTSALSTGNSPVTGAWPVQQSNGLGIDTSGHTGGNSPGLTASTGTRRSAPMTPEPVLQPPVSGFPAPETGLLAASYGHLAPSAGLPSPQAALPAPEFTAPAPGLPQTAPAFPTPQTAAQTTLPTPEFTSPAPGLPMPAPEFPLPAAADVTALAAAPAQVAAPVGATAYTSGPAYLGKADKALAFARAQIGRPCVWGATGPGAYDCSSLTQAAWKAAGVTLPRAAVDQARAFTRVGLDELQPGDLVFFHDDLSHTGLCTGDGMMIHAPGPGASIREESVHGLGEGALRGAVRPA